MSWSEIGSFVFVVMCGPVMAVCWFGLIRTMRASNYYATRIKWWDKERCCIAYQKHEEAYLRGRMIHPTLERSGFLGWRITGTEEVPFGLRRDHSGNLVKIEEPTNG